MPSSARPKRAGEHFARTHHDSNSEPIGFDGPSSSKRPRFDLRNPSALAPDALEEDAVLDADEIGRRGQGVRRNAVNIDGYESDSDNDNFDARAEAKAQYNKGTEKEDENEDMFAELEEDLADTGDAEDTIGKKKKKQVTFLKDEEIEGQIRSSSGGHRVIADLRQPARQDSEVEEELESASDVGDEERARLDENMDEELGAGSKKIHAPLLDAFNMRQEQEEGQFDQEGNYVRKVADPDAIHDTWLEGVSKRDIRRAKEAADKRDAERREKDRENDKILTIDLLRTLITNLELGETTLEALARLGKGLKKKPKWQKKQKSKSKLHSDLSNGTVDTEMSEDSPQDAARRATIEKVTEAADLLLTRGQPDIYDVARELLTRQFRRETGKDWVDSSAETALAPVAGDIVGTKMWEYRWSDARDGGEIHGPYDGAMMQTWMDAGYFGEGVEFRQVISSESRQTWSQSVEFT